MCGIWTYLLKNGSLRKDILYKSFEMLQYRGPDRSNLTTLSDKNIISDNKLLFNWNDSDIIKIDKYIKENTIINTPYDDYYNMILKIKRYIYDTKVKLGLLFSNNSSYFQCIFL